MKNSTIFAAVSIALFTAASAATGCSSSTSSTAGTGGATSSSASTTGTGGTTTASTGSATGGTTTSSTTSSTSSTTGTGGSSNPAPPTIGMQLDRMGRPAINTALNHAFDGTAAAGTAKDAYNADSAPAGWAAAYTAQFEANLAIIDALDGTCGNQLGYTASTPLAASDYGLIGGALTNDVIYVNTAGATATQYLAVEANALGVVVNTDQGGRKLNYVVLDTTYSALAIGALTGVSNGIITNNVAFSTTFPYEAAPN